MVKEKMDELKQAIILSLDSNISEIVQLAKTINFKIVKEYYQQRSIPDINFFIGCGKLDEVVEYIKSSDEQIDLIIVNGELKPSQWFNLEKKLSINVYDRLRLILEIFSEHAKLKEARLQVKLAQLQYERPYVKEMIHRFRSGEHPGLMAGGEYQVDDYYEMIKKQMKKIRSDLEKIRNERATHRKTRYKSGFYLVSLAGYTNAGKSSLLNLLAGENVTVEGELFSTLSTTTRRIPKDNKKNSIPLMLTDTVGFIENLPSWILDAFHSTLEEIQVADVVVLVVDGSEKKDMIMKKLHVSMEELLGLGVTSPIIIALNKIDVISKECVNDLISFLDCETVIDSKKIVPISVEKQINITVLLQTIHDYLPNLAKLKLQLPMNSDSQTFVSYLYKNTRIIDISYTENIILYIECNLKIKDKILSMCEQLQGIIID
ncbi:MAG: GTPase HflX [Thermoplasmatota archaeon]